MTTAQKIIKYLAIAFAIFLIVAIISAVLGGLNAFSHVLGLRKESKESSNMKMVEKNFSETNIEELKLDLAYVNLKIKTGESFYVETNNDKIEYFESNNKIEIKEKGINWFGNQEERELILYVPTYANLKKVKINAGAGKIEVDKLIAEQLEFELGAGETILNNLEISEKCDIDGGAGKLTINSSNINNLELDMGAGKVDINAKITGNSDIDAGLGSLNIGLFGTKEDYKFKVDKGIGAILINGENASDNQEYGNGENYINIDGGVGKIEIYFIDERI